MKTILRWMLLEDHNPTPDGEIECARQKLRVSVTQRELAKKVERARRETERANAALLAAVEAVEWATKGKH